MVHNRGQGAREVGFRRADYDVLGLDFAGNFGCVRELVVFVPVWKVARITDFRTGQVGKEPRIDSTREIQCHGNVRAPPEPYGILKQLVELVDGAVRIGLFHIVEDIPILRYTLTLLTVGDALVDELVAG